MEKAIDNFLKNASVTGATFLTNVFGILWVLVCFYMLYVHSRKTTLSQMKDVKPIISDPEFVKKYYVMPSARIRKHFKLRKQYVPKFILFRLKLTIAYIQFFIPLGIVSFTLTIWLFYFFQFSFFKVLLNGYTLILPIILYFIEFYTTETRLSIFNKRYGIKSLRKKKDKKRK